MNASKAEWYLRRLQRMSPSEVAWRGADFARRVTWARRRVAPGAVEWSAEQRRHLGQLPRALGTGPRFEATLDAGAIARVPAEASARVIAAGDDILAGRYSILGVVRKDLQDPDWFLDPVTGRRAPQAEYCFRIDYRSEQVTGNVKQVWELSRLQHLTVLAAAYAVSGDERYAERCAQHLRSWWSQNTFLSGTHWTSGIEVGIRLITWVWVRRLLEGWNGARALFEENELARTQIWWHQKYLAGFRSRGSSANNHVIAEAAGRLVAGLAFGWFDESEEWADEAAAVLKRELANNTFPSGVNRELAFEYHGFVAELGLVAAAEAEKAGRPLGEDTWDLLARMLDVVAATVDVRLRAPRQGDGDDGRALVLEPSGNRWEQLLALGGIVFGALDWWPQYSLEVTSVLVASLAGYHPRAARPMRRPSHFEDAGLTIMRTAPSEMPEIWCRCDAGPHGFLSIAAHAHADALAVEVRYGGTEVLADPGTYCYQGEPRWRSYFRSTLGHNTVEIAERDQSRSGGPTLWIRHARSRLLGLDKDDVGEVTRWSAEHDGYLSLDPPAIHRRTVELSSGVQRISILDRVETSGSHLVRVALHLGPEIGAKMRDRAAELEWTNANGYTERATLHLSGAVRWTAVRGSLDPVLGWYSPSFGVKQPATTILGEKSCSGSFELQTVLQFHS